MKKTYQYDVLVIGSGAAGLTLALSLAENARVAVISKGQLQDGATVLAQGGISAVIDQCDSIDSHINDTLDAGAGLCDPDVVRFTVEKGKESIQWLIDQGVIFTPDPEGKTDYHLTREGGHSHRRVVHAADATGKAIEKTLEQRVRNKSNITVYEHHIAVDLITGSKLGLKSERCLGAYVLDKDTNKVKAFHARFVVLATGGAGKVYLYTSNPDVSTGDGIAMAWRAGCRVCNMEFIQFHPTCLYHSRAKTFLISEAVRGEGGVLRLPDGTPFMERFDSRAELAPRDIVARAIDYEMKRLGSDYVLLDISHKDAGFIKRHFPTIYQRCIELGYDITRQAIPVVPAAHYLCGGIMTNKKGQTDINGLYAIGETAHTGLHGANRMASNSLLECLVFASSAARDINTQLASAPIPPALPEWDESRVTDSDEEVIVTHNWNELRRFMRDYVGIVRTNKRLQRAKRRVQMLAQEVHEYYGNFRITSDLIELRNLVQVAELIIDSAILRKESRGLHYSLDYPEISSDETHTNTILNPPPPINMLIKQSEQWDREAAETIQKEIIQKETSQEEIT